MLVEMEVIPAYLQLSFLKVIKNQPIILLSKIAVNYEGLGFKLNR
jgi:hypothetical protein